MAKFVFIEESFKVAIIAKSLFPLIHNRLEKLTSSTPMHSIRFIRREMSFGSCSVGVSARGSCCARVKVCGSHIACKMNRVGVAVCPCAQESRCVAVGVSRSHGACVSRYSVVMTRGAVEAAADGRCEAWELR